MHGRESKDARRARSRGTSGTVLLAALGLLWAMRIAAIKAAGLSGVPVHIVVASAALGLGVVFTLRAIVCADWPPIDGRLVRFYLLTGAMGFLAPFALESAVAPHLPVFVFVVIIATMPIMTLILSILTGAERPDVRAILAVSLGFACAVAILWETAQITSTVSSPWWVVAAFGVPVLYALNTVFVAQRWPAQASAVQVAHAQALIVCAATLVGSVVAGTLEDLRLAALDPVALSIIVAGEALALLVYLRITREYGATWVSFANYLSMIFGDVLGLWVFGDRIGPLTVVAAMGIIGSITLYQRRQA